MGFSVWFQPIQPVYAERLGAVNYDDLWSVPRPSMQGDLLLIYTSGGTVASGTFSRSRAPLHFRELKNSSILKSAGFVRGKMRARCDVSECWPELHRMVTARNPTLKRELVKFGPERL